MAKFKIGIDIGGTNTDLVLVNNQDKILYACKTTTTDPVDKGFSCLLDRMFKDGTCRVKPEQISGVFVGTTHVVNAILQRKGMFKVGVIRLTGSAGKCLESCYGWPQDLKDAILAGYEIVDGGYYCDAREIAPIDKEKIVDCVQNLLKKGAESFAIIGTYASLKNEQELLVAEIIKSLAGQDIPVCMSSEVGGVGFIERENATILNAALKKCIENGFSKLEGIIRDNNLSCPIFITQNNGTIISFDDAARLPILTISSGPTNSFVGASKLANLQDAVIADIGGTSTDVGIVLDNFSRRSLESTDIGGVKLNFPMPDVLSIGIGGGSYICINPNGEILIGPDSAGRMLESQAKCFGGDKLTLTDIAVAGGLVEIAGTDASKVSLDSKSFDSKNLDSKNLDSKISLDGKKSSEIIAIVKEKLVDMKKVMAGKARDLPLVLVGGGAMLFKNSEIAKICIIPDFADVANAYGAALAEISGTVDTVVKLDNRQEVIDNLIEQAVQKALASGAKAGTLRLVDKQVLPFSYVPGNLARVKITVVGKML